MYILELILFRISYTVFLSYSPFQLLQDLFPNPYLPNLVSSFSFKSTKEMIVAYLLGYMAIHWSVLNLLGVILRKKTLPLLEAIYYQ